MATERKRGMNGTFHHPKTLMEDTAKKLEAIKHHFYGDEAGNAYALTAIEEAIDALKGSAHQMQSAWNRRVAVEATFNPEHLNPPPRQ